MCRYSEQQFVDCNEFGTPRTSCGRIQMNAWNYLNVTGIGLMTTKAYPYLAKVKLVLANFVFKDKTECKIKIILHKVGSCSATLQNTVNYPHVGDHDWTNHGSNNISSKSIVNAMLIHGPISTALNMAGGMLHYG